MTEIEHVLVTGGCGFIGANLVRFLRERTPWRVRVIDNLQTGDPAHVPEDLAEVVEGNVADPKALEPALEGIDAVIHLASTTGVVPSVEDPAWDFEGNAVPTFRLLDACRRRGIDRVVFASSGATLGEAPPPVNEEVLPRPLSPYGAGKLAGEAYCQAFAASHGMHTAALRFSNVYGPFSLRKKGNAVPNFIRRCLSTEPMVVYGDGMQTRDFIYVEDLCDCIHRAATAEGIGGEVFQVAMGAETSILDLAELVRKVTGAESEILFEPKRAGEIYKSWADISKARRILGFDPQIDLEEGITRTVDWYRANWTPA
ncbi:MAG TPA: NAD-dependent epimerase/dehydratase family protein [Actinomycetota bacterium]|nr:NAD-dependent epimerase/dehydratase family protein [Actinomycetota bacterium]